jgi:hypothetical protein
MVRLEPPKERNCTRCGRRDRWNAEVGTWTAIEEGGRRQVGTPHCVHEWDINGNYTPIAE